MRRQPLMRRLPIGDLPSELETGHNRLMPGWRDVARESAGIPIDRRRGNFSSAVVKRTLATSQRALPLNWRRVYLLIYNADTTNDLWINLSADAAINGGIKIPPGGNWEPWVAPVNEVHFIGVVAQQLAIFVEGAG